MNATKMTLTATVLAAALGLALGLSAVPSGSYACHKDTPHGNQTDCDNGGGGAIVYEATLTGAFEFDSVVVTPNTRENVLRSDTELNMSRPNNAPDRTTWDDVFVNCPELLEGVINDIFVGRDDWQIDKSGGVRVRFHDILLQDAKIIVQLIGDQFDFDDPSADNQHPFLPAPGKTSVFELTQAKINGRSLMGGPGGSQACEAPGGGSADEFDLFTIITLEITAE